jgi:hypothetical protein
LEHIVKQQELTGLVTALQKGSYDEGDTCKRYCIFENTKLRKEEEEEEEGRERQPSCVFTRFCRLTAFTNVT